ncbi:MAG TPA: hypothetical protein VH417_07735 [Vicinamibacterales bacterium]
MSRSAIEGVKVHVERRCQSSGVALAVNAAEVTRVASFSADRLNLVSRIGRGSCDGKPPLPDCRARRCGSAAASRVSRTQKPPSFV